MADFKRNLGFAAWELQLHRNEQVVGVTANADIAPKRLESLFRTTEKADHCSA